MTAFRMIATALGAALLTASSATAQEASTARETLILPSPGGETIVPGPWRRAYDEIGYAPARRIGDTLYVSGAVGGLAPGQPQDEAGLEAAARSAFDQLEIVLKAAGATFNDVVMINSFHVWDGPETSRRMMHVQAMKKVMDERWTGPRPAWTAVGTTGLLMPTGVMEIQLIVHAPLPASIGEGCGSIDNCR